jgi:peptide/nickel transport system substrate-binding protein
MNRQKLFVFAALLVVASMILSACGKTTTAVPATVKPATAAPTEAVPVLVATQPAPTAGPTFTAKYNLSAPDCTYGGEFKSIEAVDQNTVKFTLCYPDPAFLSKIALASFGIQPAAYLEKTSGGGTGSDLLTHPVGTGPFMLAQWQKGQEVDLTRFDEYWGAKALTKTVVFRWSAESAQRLQELQAGTVDAIDNVGPQDSPTVEADKNLQMLPREAMNIMYIGINNTYPPFDKAEVRQAIALGIDRARIIKNFYPAGSTVADYFTPCAITNACVGDKFYDFDPVAAKALLAKAGFPNGFQTELAIRDVVRGYLPNVTNVAQDIQAQLKANLNIDASITVMESGTFIDAANKGELKGLHLLGWTADYPDQTNFLDVFFGAGANKSFGTTYPDLVSVLKQGAAVADPAARKPFYIQANNLIKQYVPAIPVAHGGSAVAYKATAQGANVSALGDEMFAPVQISGQDTLVWMQNAEPISLYGADESDGESLRPYIQITEGLYGFKTGTTEVVPFLATECKPNAELTEWNCALRQNVKFHDGSVLNANDVVESFVVQWDASNPLHKGNTGEFYYMSTLFSAFLNAPK